MALAVISTAFPGQAIAVAFDRRYGAHQQTLGATALPVWGIIAGKGFGRGDGGVLQAILLGGIGLALGWRKPSPAGLLLGPVISRWAPRRSWPWACCGRNAARRDRAGRGEPALNRLRRAGRADAGDGSFPRRSPGWPGWPVRRAHRGAVAGDGGVPSTGSASRCWRPGARCAAAAVRWFQFTPDRWDRRRGCVHAVGRPASRCQKACAPSASSRDRRSASQALISVTGSVVRVTASGLGPAWPQCFPTAAPGAEVLGHPPSGSAIASSPSRWC